MEISEKLNDLFDEFQSRFGYQLTEKNDECGYLKFERTVEGCNHLLILEDHRWELKREDFDPDTDIGDWLIFSMLTNEERDWFGHFVETQYPLTYKEYKLIEEIIHEIERFRLLRIGEAYDIK